MTASEIVLGIDLDNTLVCYDELFHLAAREEHRATQCGSHRQRDAHAVPAQALRVAEPTGRVQSRANPVTNMIR